ncbi:MAG TPA: hypothetical protein VJ882_01085, partial [Desulfuromonadales bacterium]|nr:hypothetical protein [Desulfuromonadales bacterium]
MKISTLIRTVLAASLLVFSACGGGDSGSSENTEDLQKLIDENAPAVTEDGETGAIGQLGKLVDLGDLLEPDGDHWYYTRPAAINDNGIIVGQSNNGSPVNPNISRIRDRAAFEWDPASGEMTFLDNEIIFSLSPEDHIYSEAIDLNGSGSILVNTTTGVNWPEERLE